MAGSAFVNISPDLSSSLIWSDLANIARQYQVFFWVGGCLLKLMKAGCLLKLMKATLLVEADEGRCLLKLMKANSPNQKLDNPI